MCREAKLQLSLGRYRHRCQKESGRNIDRNSASIVASWRGTSYSARCSSHSGACTGVASPWMRHRLRQPFGFTFVEGAVLS